MATYTREQRIQRYMRRTIGTMVLISAALAFWVSPYWLLLTAFVGANMLQFGFTDWCLMKSFFEKMVKE